MLPTLWDYPKAFSLIIVLFVWDVRIAKTSKLVKVHVNWPKHLVKEKKKDSRHYYISTNKKSYSIGCQSEREKSMEVTVFFFNLEHKLYSETGKTTWERHVNHESSYCIAIRKEIRY